jgi:hypothetical protein
MILRTPGMSRLYWNVSSKLGELVQADVSTGHQVVEHLKQASLLEIVRGSLFEIGNWKPPEEIM